MLTYYASTFLDESLSSRDKRGNQHRTGRLSGMIFTRRYFKKGTKIKSERGLITFSWDEDTQEAKAAALAKAITGMEELPGLDENPPLNWVPPSIKERLS